MRRLKNGDLGFGRRSIGEGIEKGDTQIKEK